MIIIFSTALIIQLVYMFVYTMAINRYKTIYSTKQSTLPVSVIVCAFNELKNLKVLIPKLLTQNHANFEVIIVNDQSTDGTYEYLMSLKKDHVNVKMVQIDETPDHFSRKKYGITLGIKASTYDVIVFTDADCYPQSDQWLTSVADQYSDDTEIVIAPSLYEKKRGVLNQFIRYETFWTAIQYLGCALMGVPYMGVGRNLSYRKSLFLNNKGFKEHQQVTGGDDDLFVNEHAKRQNTRVIMGSDILTYSYPKTTIRSFFRQKTRHLSVGKYYKFKHQIILGFYALTHLFFWATSIGLIFVYPEIIGIGLTIRIGAIYLMYYVTSKKIGEVYVPLILPLLDIVYGFYYIATTVSTVFSKKIKWR